MHRVNTISERNKLSALRWRFTELETWEGAETEDEYNTMFPPSNTNDITQEEALKLEIENDPKLIAILSYLAKEKGVTVTDILTVAMTEGKKVSDAKVAL